MDVRRSEPKGPIFIVGCPRSGTTLLQRMLDAHPAVAIAPETHFVRRFYRRRRRYGRLSADENYRRLVDDVIAMPEFAEMQINARVFREAAWRIARDYGRLFGLLLKHFADARGAEVVGEKTPNHALYMRTLERFFPTARFVHIVRDPRAVVNSWRHVPWTTGSLSGDAEVWRRYVAAARRRPPLAEAGLVELRYEDLIAAPEETLRRLCRSLDIELDWRMLAYDQQKPSTTNVVREPWKRSATLPLSRGPLNRWREELSRRMVAWVEAGAWQEMGHFGYVRETPPWRLVPMAGASALMRPLRLLIALIRKLTPRRASAGDHPASMTWGPRSRG